MIEGVEPMRTFGDLLQFYQKKKEGDDNDTPGPRAQKLTEVEPPVRLPFSGRG
jgi:hypothetical protein